MFTTYLMHLSTFKEHLASLEYPVFVVASGSAVPAHYHITEIGVITKEFIDCGGVMRTEKVVNFQLRYAGDLEHRLSAQKLLGIIKLFEEKISSDDYPVEIEYQAETIGKYGLEWAEDQFVLSTKKTDCLAKDKCGIPEEQLNCCGGGCC